VLFNTLAFAKFFVVVFVVAWLLVSRRAVLLLPWFAVGGYVALSPPTLVGYVIAAAAFALSLELCRRHREDDRPSPRLAASSVAINFIALSFLTLRTTGVDPVTLALRGLEAPAGAGTAWTIAALVAGPVLLGLLVRAKKVRMVFILLASYVFYAHWDWRFLPLIWGSSTIDWWLGRMIGRARTPAERKRWLAGTVVLNLSVLGVFKYFNFGIDTARATLLALGLEPPEIALRIALPVGISFFTFESMSYVIDVYRGVLKPKWSYFEYLSFVAFFPHLVAGPIVRPRDLLPQLADPARWSTTEASEGLFLVMVGLLKKVAIGDYLAINLVDRVFDAPTQYSALECYAAVLGYAVQIYTDFSGYTDIAIGTALLLGVRMPLNFNAPYKAPEIIDFWRRWHISLSTWLRDYLYVSLGGNRKGRARTYVNLMVTMLLGGLWHGAAWTFMVWGGLHGWALAVTRAVGETRRKWAKLLALCVPAVAAGPLLGGVMCLLLGEYDASLAMLFTVVGWLLGLCLALGALYRAWEYPDGKTRRAPALGARSALLSRTFAVLSVLATFHVVCAGWIYFRSETFRQAATFFSQLATLTSYHPNLNSMLVGALAVGMLTHWAPERWYAGARETFIRTPAPVQAMVLIVAALVLREMASAEAVPFVYFQF
jgi:alginate O-acetyltransferase complex protein AlgI